MQNFVPFSQYSYIPHRMKHSFRSRAMYMLLLLSVCVAVVSLFFITVDVSVQSRGVVTTANRQSVVVCATYGRVINSVLVENAEVKRGDLLLVLDTIDIARNIGLVQGRMLLLEQEIIDLQALTSTQNLKIGRRLFATQKYRQEYHRIKSQIECQNADVSIYRKEYERQQTLYRQKVVADAEMEQSHYRYRSAELKVKQLLESQMATRQGELLACTNQLMTL